MGSREATLRVWDQENASTLKVLRAVPNAHITLKPHPRGWRMKDLAWHLVTSERWFCTGPLGLATAGPDPAPKDAPPSSGAAMAEAREKSHAALAAAAAKQDARWFEGEVEFYGTRMPREEVLRLMLRHEAHHRGQLTVFLRLAGAKVPGVYGPSADEKDGAGEEE
jgi:uncharacterized damage-inducible protein DinB